ncbi:major facilitator superfamily domain-containing protein [Haematococcus lacustris]
MRRLPRYRARSQGNGTLRQTLFTQACTYSGRRASCGSVGVSHGCHRPTAWERRPRAVRCYSHAGVTDPAQPPSLPSPSQAVATVVLPTALALLLCNMDRICLSVAIIPMSAEFGWAESYQGVIQSAFLWGYMATQLLGGALADKYGGKLVLAGGMLWFSLASLLLPLALSPPVVAAGLTLPAMLLARCCVGLGEGVALPAMNNLVASFIPKDMKARALGLCFTGFHTGNLVGLVLSPLILLTWGWRWLFSIFGFMGAPLLLMWMTVVPNKPVLPASTPAPAPAAAEPGLGGGSMVSQASMVTPRQVTPASLLTHSATWAIIVVNVINHFGYFIYLNWMPTYFVKALGFDLRSSSFMAFLPWLVMAVGSSLSGLLADSLVAGGVPLVRVRKGVQTVAFLVPAAALLLLAQPGLSPQVAVGLLTVALGTTSLGQAGFVANMSDIAPQHAGMMFGLCNTFGSLSGIIGVTAVGYIVQHTKSFSPVFQLTAALYVIGALVWQVFATADRVF